MTVVPIRSSYTAVFASALQGVPCEVVGLTADPHTLPVAEWSRGVDAGDAALLDQCRGATLDIGCGPGRMTRALAERGHAVLGIDIVPEAVRMTRGRGGVALVRDVFRPVPGEGRWRTALLADGNIGIGGDPIALLRRLRELLDPRGRVVAELAPPGADSSAGWATLRWGEDVSDPIRWSVVGVDGVADVAQHADLDVSAVHRFGDRWFVVLEEEP